MALLPHEQNLQYKYGHSCDWNFLLFSHEYFERYTVFGVFFKISPETIYDTSLMTKKSVASLGKFEKKTE